ncbi:hypothetical protein [Nonomuraea sp. SBT364]|uniref:hypothetical protein n=1 Tax=Nonomuraea sp. SBT364 TaxID=1580530 RepID=UPI000AB02FA1|nr:hypothetical protein [Nonomuraea sp. SBT364]
MAELRLQAGSDRVLARWWNSASCKEGDHQLVAKVLETIRTGAWPNRWYWTEDLADDPTILRPISIWPREGLVVTIRFWPAEDPPEVELIKILDLADLSEHDLREEV